MITLRAGDTVQAEPSPGKVLKLTVAYRVPTGCYRTEDGELQVYTREIGWTPAEGLKVVEREDDWE